MHKPIVVIGSINMDLVCRTVTRPAVGETIMGKDLAMIPGGKGANQAVAVARLGGDVYMVGRIGDDPFGSTLRAELKQNGVRVDHVQTTTNISSGVALIVVDRAGDNSIIVMPGANARLTPADVDAAQPVIAKAACVLLQLEIPLETVEHAIALCKRLGVYVMLDPAPAVKNLSARLFEVDLLTPNQTEARMLLNCNGHDGKLAKMLHAEGATTVVIKRGSEGAMFLHQSDGPRRFESFKVEVVDTTAAGDAFTAALGIARAEEMPWADAMRFANAAGALACTKLGAQTSLPTRVEVDALLATPNSMHI